MLRTWFYRFSIFFAWLIIVLAMLSSLVRFVFPYATNSRLHLQQIITEYTKYPIFIKQLDVGWEGFHPVIKLVDVWLYDRQGFDPILHMGELNVSIAPFKSLWHRKLIPDVVSLAHLDLSVVNTQKTHIDVFGINQKKITDFDLKHIDLDKDLLGWLLARRKVYIDDLNLLWKDENETVIPFTNIQLLMKQEGTQHTIKGIAQLKQTKSTLMKFQFDVQKHSNQSSEWKSQLFLQVDNLLLNQWANWMSWKGYQANHGELNGQLWANFTGFQLNELQVGFKLNQLNVTSPVGANHFIQAVSGKGFYDHHDFKQRWIGDITELNLAGQPLPSMQITYEKNTDDPESVFFHLDTFTLQPFWEWLDNGNAIKNDDKIGRLPKTLSGELKSIHYQWQPKTNHWVLSGDFNGLSWAHWPNQPNIEGLSGQFCVEPQKGTLHLKSQGLKIEDSRYFTSILGFSEVSADIDWQKKNELWRIQVNQLSANNDHLSLHAQGPTLFRDINTIQTDTELTVTLNSLSKLSHYLPHQLFPKETSDWFLQAFVGNGKARGRLHWKGQLNKFPYEDDSSAGSLKAIFNLDNVDLNYAPHWIPAKQLTGQLHFNNNNLNLFIESGDINGFKLQKINASINNVGHQKATLLLEGEAHGYLSQVKTWLLNSPLKKDMASLVPIQLTGVSELALHLSLPFDDPKKMTLDGDLKVNKSSMTWPKWDIRIQDIKGRWQFDENKVVANDIHFTWMDKVGSLSLLNYYSPEQSHQDKIVLRADFDTEQLPTELQAQIQPYLKGSTPFELILSHFYDKTYPSRIHFRSDLKGLAIHLPPPLHKAKETQQPIEWILEAPWSDMWQLQVNYLPIVQAVLKGRQVHTKEWHAAGVIQLGEQPIKQITFDGLKILGQLNTLNMDVWWEWLKTLNLKKKNTFQIKAEDQLWVDLKISQLQIAKQTVKNVKFTVSNSSKAWKVDIESDQLGGEWLIPARPNDPIQAKLTHLKWNQNALDTPNRLESLEDFPSLHLTIDELNINDQLTGHFEFDGKKQNDRYRVNHWVMSGNGFHFFADGYWQLTPEKKHTYLKGHLSTHQLSNFLQWIGWHPSIDSEDANVNFALEWNNDLLNIDPKQLRGQMNLSLRKGRIMELDPTTEARLGIGKLLNILSVPSLPRRLLLDFKDVTNKGLTFDTLKGHFALKSGQATTDNTHLAGQIADIDLQGSVDFIHKTVDLLLKVSPHVAESLPVVATIAGGPVFGVATWAFNKVFVKRFEKSSGHQYHVSGSLENPEIKQIKKVRKK